MRASCYSLASVLESAASSASSAALPVEGLDFISIFLLEGLRIAAMFLAQPDHDRSGFRFAPRVDFRVTMIDEAADRDVLA